MHYALCIAVRVLCGNLCGKPVDHGGKRCVLPLVWGENGLNFLVFRRFPSGYFQSCLGFPSGLRRSSRAFRGKSCRSSLRLLLICACLAAGFCKSFFAVFQFLPDAGPASPDKTTVFGVHPAPAGRNKNKNKSKRKYKGKGKIKCKGKSKEKKKRKPFS